MIQVALPEGISDEAIGTLTKRLSIILFMVDISDSMMKINENNKSYLEKALELLYDFFIFIINDQRCKSRIASSSLSTVFTSIGFSDSSTLDNCLILPPTTHSYLQMLNKNEELEKYLQGQFKSVIYGGKSNFLKGFSLSKTILQNIITWYEEKKGKSLEQGTHLSICFFSDGCHDDTLADWKAVISKREELLNVINIPNNLNIYLTLAYGSQDTSCFDNLGRFAFNREEFTNPAFSRLFEDKISGIEYIKNHENKYLLKLSIIEPLVNCLIKYTS